jgi:3-hydroxyacyl-CoA dehydrogenase/enoyl-CoA hydratase/3-hydroxybutyryl-CoA epimerase
VSAVAASPDRDETIVTLEARRDGVAFIALNHPADAHNTITPAFGAQLDAVIDRVEQDASIAAAVVVSGKPDSFVVGANIGMLKAIKFATDAERLALAAAKTMRRLEALKKPIVAAIHGAALGGGFELALACHSIVATDDARTHFGLPEVQLGLCPAGNGMMRLAQRAGLRAAIELSLSGRELTAEQAARLGIVDDVCSRSILQEVAKRRAKALVGHLPGTRDRRPLPARPQGSGLMGQSLARPQGPGITGKLGDFALDHTPLGKTFVLRQARAQARARTHSHYPAPARIIDVFDRFVARGFDAAAQVEAKAFGDLVVSETAHRLIDLFFAKKALERDPGVDERASAREVSRAAVIGGGVIGSEVAYVTVSAGIPVRMRERDDASLGSALRTVRALVDARVARARSTPLEAEATFARLSATTDLSGLTLADLVVEAVSEDLAVKQSVLRDVEALVSPECVFAAHTASVSIAKIAQSAKHPERVLGVRYFCPVPKVPLLEVARADKTAPWAVATAVAFGKRQGKTVVVVRDSPGFYTTRAVAPLMNEALHLLSEGVGVDAVDAAMVDWGFPIGPLALLDDVGIDFAVETGQSLQAAFGERMTSPGAAAKLLADDRKGRAHRKGLYRYEGHEGRRVPDASVYTLLGVVPSKRVPVEEIQMRCALGMINEAVRCLGEGVLRSARDGDVAAIFGIGFPAFRGGPFRYVDVLGAAETLRRIQSYADRFGERWRPAPLLVQMARRGERFYG